MLVLGLERISKLVNASSLPWRAVHVAGTNGKGSVCCYTYALLRAAGVRCGMFTSPHLIDRWDCISIDGKSIGKERFSNIEGNVKDVDAKLRLNCTEFERLTATAFQAFTEASVECGVVEVGVGGRIDATNVLENPFSTIITKIGKDHENLLGNTVEAIATEKAGIMKPDLPCFVDETNSPRVKKVLLQHAQVAGAHLQFIGIQNKHADSRYLWPNLGLNHLLPHQKTGLALAVEASRPVLTAKGIVPDWPALISAAATSVLPGRLQYLNIRKLTGRTANVLLDGAHNPQSATILGHHVARIRNGSENDNTASVLPERSVAWVLAVSKGKDLRQMFSFLLRRGDSVVAVKFGSVDGMPWVVPTSTDEICDAANDTASLRSCESASTVEEALRKASVRAAEGPLVIAGSLYLVSDVLRLLRDAAV